MLPFMALLQGSCGLRGRDAECRAIHTSASADEIRTSHAQCYGLREFRIAECTPAAVAACAASFPGGRRDPLWGTLRSGLAGSRTREVSRNERRRTWERDGAGRRADPNKVLIFRLGAVC